MRRLTTWACVVATLAWVVGSCDGGGADLSDPEVPATVAPSTPPPICPIANADCLAWDDFERADGPISQALTRQRWQAQGLSCAACEPSFSIDDGRATMAPSSEKNSIWFATIDTGRDRGVTAAARIRLSPTPDRANAGLVALFVDRANHLVCKIEVTEGNPDGLIAIGEELHGVQTSLLSYRKDIGLRNGSTYRLKLAIPDHPERRPVLCTVSGPRIERQTVRYRLTPERLAAYGSGTSQGLRIKIFDDEDDGRSGWDEFLVSPT
jgi:hypothetical protein